eukprot:scaffold49135_cov76-Phaeocystis_antarctica.AAC.3
MRQHVGTEAADVRLQLAARRRVEWLRIDERGDALDLRLRRLRAQKPTGLLAASRHAACSLTS